MIGRTTPREPVLHVMHNGFSVTVPYAVADLQDAKACGMEFLHCYPEWAPVSPYPQLNTTILRDGSGYLFNVKKK